MSSINKLLTERTNRREHLNKMAEMVNRSASGNQTSFSGLFTVQDLKEAEKEQLEFLLKTHAPDGVASQADLMALISLTCEIKAIDNQAILLHGERISKAHRILTAYREGAFSSWLMMAYGNRQTPYNFFYYYRFYETMPQELKARMEEMPRQAIYSLASREGSLDQKQQIVINYAGETKNELLNTIREAFPLAKKDKRKVDLSEQAMRDLQKIIHTLQRPGMQATREQKSSMAALLATLRQLVDQL